jgi:cobalt-zinc-cadmium efflux system outer membrane protein
LLSAIVPPAVAEGNSVEQPRVVQPASELAGAPPAPLRSFSLQTCFDKALANNKEIIAAAYNLPTAKAGIKIAGAIPNPRFNLQYGWGPAFTIIIAGNPQQFGWQQEIQTAGKRTKQIKLARANYELTALQLAQVQFDVHNRVRRAYAELAAAEAYIDLIESERKVSAELADTAEKRFQAGKAPKSDALQAELGVLQFDTQRSQAQARLKEASAALSLLIGETPQHVEIIDVDDNGIFKLSAEKTDIVPPADRAMPGLDDLLKTAYEQRPDLKVAVQQKFADRKALSLAVAKAVPDIFVDSGYQFTTFKRYQPYGLTAFGTTPVQSGAYLNVAVETPIFYQQQGEISQAKNTLKQDGDQINQLIWQIATDTVTAYEQACVARANIEKFQTKIIPEASQVAYLARRRYQVGKADLASAILAKQQYQQILSSYFDAVVAYQIAWADLEKALGVPLRL